MNTTKKKDLKHEIRRYHTLLTAPLEALGLKAAKTLLWRTALDLRALVEVAPLTLALGLFRLVSWEIKEIHGVFSLRLTGNKLMKVTQWRWTMKKSVTIDNIVVTKWETKKRLNFIDCALLIYVCLQPPRLWKGLALVEPSISFCLLFSRTFGMK